MQEVDPPVAHHNCKFQDWMPSKIIELMTDGASKVEVCAELGISRETLNVWCQTTSHYFNGTIYRAIKKGELLSQAWWEKLGRQGASMEKEIQPTAWIFNMKNRFNWCDKQEQKIDANINHSVDKDVLERFEKEF